MPRNILIMGAAGKDFHVFNTCYRENTDARVVAFTATQIPHIEGRQYPPSLAGSQYPDGIPIHDESELTELIRQHSVDEVVFAYSDVSNDYLAGRQRTVEAAGAKFSTFDVDATMLPSNKPVVAICAVRTGCGKSPTTRRILRILQAKGLKAVAIRHPMPYGDLAKQAVQRFAELDDLKKHECTIEEMEEYEPIIQAGHVVYAGVDYAAILAEAEKEADVILWDGGNNDTPFYKPDLWITVADPLRAGHELRYFPGTENFKRCDVILINKVDRAEASEIAAVKENAAELNPGATVVSAECRITVEDESLVQGKQCLVVEDGPTLTHGEMKYGAGVVACERLGAASLVDPRPWAVGEIQETFDKYPDLGVLLPAMGYGDGQVKDLEQTINAVECESVVIGTPIDLARIIDIRHPSTRVRYEVHEVSEPNLADLLEQRVTAPLT